MRFRSMRHGAVWDGWMHDNPRDLHDGELASDADLDPTGVEPEAEQGEGYVDPIEQDVEDAAAPRPTNGHTPLP
jgi:hypothetical protein